MSEKVVAIYENLRTARSAVRELEEYGFERDHIRVAAETGQQSFQYLEGPMQSGLISVPGLSAGETVGARLGAAIGATAGAVGGMVYGIEGGLLVFTASVLFGAVVGALACGLVGWIAGLALGLGIPDEEAAQYAESIRRGGVQVEVDAEAYTTGLLRVLLCQRAGSEQQPAENCTQRQEAKETE